MRNIARETAQQRQELFAATSNSMGITPAAAEKDFWIVWCLDVLFSMKDWAPRLRFKGGTSLSKAYGLIERFSEDIDLILDWTGLSEEAPDGERSKTQQQRLNVEINHSAQRLIQERLLPDLQNVVSPLCQAHLDRDAPPHHQYRIPGSVCSGLLAPRCPP